MFRTFQRVITTVASAALVGSVLFAGPVMAAAGGSGASSAGATAIAGPASPGHLDKFRKKATVDVAKLKPATRQKPSRKAEEPTGEDDEITPVDAGVVVPTRTTGRSSTAVGGSGPIGSLSVGTAALSGNFASGEIELEQLTGATFGGSTPPDNGFGVGPSDIVQFVNTSGFVYDRTAAHTQRSTFNLSAFFGAPVNPTSITDPRYSDPRVLYDKPSGRWFAAILIFDGCSGASTCTNKNNSEIDIAVSASSNPAATWNVYPVGINNSNQLLDQPKLGVSGDKAVMTWNITGFSGPYQFIEVQKSDLVTLAGSVNVTTFAQDTTHYNVIPVVTLGSSNTEYAASINRGGSTLTVFEFTGTPTGGNAAFTTHDFSVGTVTDPPKADQKGDSRQLDTGTAGEQSAVWQNGVLWAAGNTTCTPPGDSTTRSCLSFHSVNTNSWSLRTDATVGQNGAHLFYPSVMVDAAGNLFAGHSVSSTTQYATAGNTYFAGGSIGSSNPGIDYKGGVGGYNCTFCYDKAVPPNPTRNRWGDYSGAAQDPNNANDVWLSEEFGTFNTASTDNWAVEIGRFTAAAPVVTGLSPTHASELSSSCAPLVTVTGREFQLGATVKFGGVTASSTVVTPETLTATAPSHVAGTVNVTVTTPNGTSAASAANEFTYDPDNEAPVTVATLTTAANVNNWNKADFTVNFNATDGPSSCGSGVKDITVDSSGAVISGPTTTSGASASLFIGTEGITTIHYHATDNAGNIESTQTLIVRLDKTLPSVACGSPDTLWHAADVSIDCTASDGLSGLANPADASFSLSTSVPVGTETALAYTNSRNVFDLADNLTVAGPLGPNKIDKKPPVITITTPASGATYIINQPVAAAYGCTDGGSGLAMCVGTVANGSNINTSSVGTKMFIVNATDNVGNASSTTYTYYVTYKICLLYDPSVPFARNNQVPIKLEICDYNNVNLSSAGITLTAVSVTPSRPLVSNSNPDFKFRFDSRLAVGGGYIFNLVVKTFPPGGYTLDFTVTGDPATHHAPFTVK
ncbi:MAG: IPT/TIG domain-containing protein [Chloroflexota bacterium]